MTPFLKQFRLVLNDYTETNAVIVLQKPLFDKLRNEIINNTTLVAEAYIGPNKEGVAEAFNIVIGGTSVTVFLAETTPAFKELEQFL